MADDDEVDVLGDFNLENLLTKDENRLTSCYDGSVGTDLLHCDYPPSWYLDVGSPSCWYERSQLDSFAQLPLTLPLSSSPGSLQWNDATSGVNSSGHAAAANWTEKERSLLEEGLELFGRSWSRLAQFVGTKTSHQIKTYLRMARPGSECEIQPFSQVSSSDGTIPLSSTPNDLAYTELIDDMQIPASMEEVIAVVSTAQPTVPASLSHMTRGADAASGATATKKKKIRSPQVIKAKRGRPPRMPPPKPLAKRGRGRPRKVQGPNEGQQTTTISSDINLISELTTTPRLGEEIVRIRKQSHSSDGSDIEIDIEDDDFDRCETQVCTDSCTVKSLTVSPTENLKNDVSTIKEECVEPICKTPDEVEEAVYNKHDIDSGPGVEVGMKQENSHADENTECISAKDGKALLSHQDILDQIHQIPPPVMECILKSDEITEEEQFIHAEFFEGRPAKTPKRYLKIRNHIIDTWLQSKPAYVTKTSVRTGLRNCGDVNCIGRIHSYLEQIGAINFGCEQTRYHHGPPDHSGHANKPLSSNMMKDKPNRELLCMEGMRPRKKKHEIDEDLMGSVEGGYTIEHSDDGQTTLTYNSVIKPKVAKSDNSIKLLYCAKFSSEKPAPFTIDLYVSALLVVDIHAHCSHDTEVMGLLGGELRKDTLHILRAVPCQSSLSSSTHCDMCPVSQSEANEVLAREGLSVVGWYHSHPTFLPNPSLQDMSTQSDMQRWFSDTSAAPFVGLILSPYLANSTTLASQYRVLIVDPEGESGGTPYRFPVDVVSEDLDTEELLTHVENMLTSMEHPALDGPLYTHTYDPALPQLSCFQKCMESVRLHLESSQPPLSGDGRMSILKGIRDICRKHCSV